MFDNFFITKYICCFPNNSNYIVIVYGERYGNKIYRFDDNDCGIGSDELYEEVNQMESAYSNWITIIFKNWSK